jgi:hypothetical protein
MNDLKIWQNDGTPIEHQSCLLLSVSLCLKYIVTVTTVEAA